MQLALDPNIGKKEIGDLNKELHLKQLELEKLKQAQEKMVQDITKAVNKKDSIELKYGGEKKTGITGKKARPSGVQPNSVSQNIQIIKRKIKENSD